MPPSQQQIADALRTIKDPELFKDIVSLGLVKEVKVADDGTVGVFLVATMPPGALRGSIEDQIRSALGRIGVEKVHVELPPVAAQQAVAGSPLPQVKNIIAVGAGKGGVGKSTVALNLAIGLQRRGHEVGLMDGDIYGPSMPTLLGIKGATPKVQDGKILPIHVHGLHAITIGSLVESEKPLIWRGPMAHGAFKQLLLDNTLWPELDYLIVDLPPGTGDVPLTLCQLLPLTGAVVVATPQQVALDDAVRAVRMFQQLGSPVLGLVENMSYFVGPDGSEHDIFGRGGTEAAAARLELPYLGALPMFTELRIHSDIGRPHANYEINPKLRAALEAIVTRLGDEVDERNARQPKVQLNVI